MTTSTLLPFEREQLNLHRELYYRVLRARRDLPHVSRLLDLPKCPVEVEDLEKIEAGWRKEFERRA
jgi:hypothetical protein